jgi:hypothetical protein
MIVVNPVHGALNIGLVVVHDDGNDVVVVVTARLLQVVRGDVLLQLLTLSHDL